MLLDDGLRRCTRPEDRSVVADYLGCLAPMLGKVVLGATVLDRIQEMDRRLGQTWVTDVAPFERGLARYADFKAEYERFVLGGMTVNERLHALGLTEQADSARAAGDAETLRGLLRRALVPESDIESAIAKLRR